MLRLLKPFIIGSLPLLVGGQALAKTSISFWITWDTSSTIGKSFVTMAQKFNQSQQDIEVQVVPVASYRDKLAVALAGDSAPDTFVLDDLDLFAGFLEPLEPFFQREGIPLDDFIPGLLRGGRIGNVLYGIPYMAAFMGFAYYNVDHLTQAGISGPPLTWKDLQEFSRKLVRFEGDRLVRPGFELPPGGGGLLQAFYSLALQNGSLLLKPSEHDLSWDDDASVGAWEFVWQLCQQRLCDARGLSWGDRFLRQQASIYYGPSGFLGTIEQNATFDWNISPPLSNVRPAAIGSGWMYAINRKSRNKEAAWKWIAYLLSPDGMLQRAVLSGQLPSRSSVLHNRYFTQNPRDLALIASTEVLYTDAHPLLRATLVQQELIPRLQAALRGDGSARSLIAEAARLVRSKMVSR